MSTDTTTRRGLLRLATGTLAYGAGAAAVAGAGFAVSEAKGATPFKAAHARYEAASARFNALPDRLDLDDPVTFEREEDAYLDTYRAFIKAPASNWQEFVTALEEALAPGGSPSGEQCAKLLADARRLAKREG